MNLRSANKNKETEPPKKQSNGIEKAKKQPPKKAEKAPKVAKVAKPKPKAAKEAKKPAPKTAKKTAKSKPAPVPEPSEPMDEDEVVEIPRKPQSTAVRAVRFESPCETTTTAPKAPSSVPVAVVPQAPKAVAKKPRQQTNNGNGVSIAPVVAKKAPPPKTQPNGVLEEIAVELPDIIAPPTVPIVPPPAPVVVADPVLRPTQKQKPKKAPNTVRATFDEYANDRADKDTPGKIGPNGVVRLLEDLNIDAMDRRVLIMAHRMNAQVMCEFTWEEWQLGMETLGANSVATLAARLTQQDKGLADLESFKDVHKFTFTYGKQAGKRNLDVDVAIPLWQILFKNEYPLLPLWEEFLTTVHKKDITFDLWKMFLDFATTLKPDLSDYDEEEAWPNVLDTFVNWVRPKLNKA